MLKETIFGSILLLAQPGYSDWSRVVAAEECDQECQEQVLLHTGKKIEFNYDQKIIWVEGKSRRIVWEGWTRPETRMEGMLRYATAAEAIEYVVNHPPKGWKWSKRDLYRGLVTISFHESAYWRSVQEGRVRGPAGEVCYVQIHPKSGLDVDLEDLVGLDMDSVIRCYMAGATLLTRSRAYVESSSYASADWWGHTISLYGSGKSPEINPWAHSRIDTYSKVSAKREFQLDFDANLALIMNDQEPYKPNFHNPASIEISSF